MPVAACACSVMIRGISGTPSTCSSCAIRCATAERLHDRHKRGAVDPGAHVTSSKSHVERYRSPLSGMTTTTSLPTFLARCANARAAQTAPPPEIPARIHA